MSKKLKLWSTGALAATAMMLGAAGWQTSAYAGSDNSTDTYAGDYGALGLPIGSVLVTSYSGWRHGDEYIQNNNNFLGKLGFPVHSPADVSLWTDIERVDWFATSIWNHPIVLSAAIPLVQVDNHSIASPTTAPIGGNQTYHDGVGTVVLFATYGLVVEPRNERYIGISNYFYLPTNNYRATKIINTGSANEYTDVPQIGWTEGLGKLGLRNFWFDFIGNASIHSDGKDPVTIPLGTPGIGGFGYSNVSQDTSFDVKGFLRYDFAQSFWVAAGIEKSWGGNQIASGGSLSLVPGFATSSLGKDDFLKGHIQASYPITRDFHAAIDLTHDFERTGGIKEDFTAEIRVTKFFIPSVEPLK